MIIKSKTYIADKISSEGQLLPIIPTKSSILFPGESMTLQLIGKQNLRLVDEHYGKRKLVGVVFSPRGNIDGKRIDLCQIGTSARIISKKKGTGQSMMVVLEGVGRIVIQAIQKKSPYLIAKTASISISKSNGTNGRHTEEITQIMGQITKVNPSYSESLMHLIRLNLEDPGRLADRIASGFHFPIEIKQEILESIEVDRRLTELHRNLKIELSKSTVYYQGETTGKEHAQYTRSMSNHSNYLNMEIAQEILKRVNKIKDLPYEVRERCLIEIDRLKNLSSASAEFGTTKQYLEWLISLPWNRFGKEKYNLKRVEKEIDQDYYGPKNVKRAILERIAIRKLSGKTYDASILCLSGVAGTGKSSLAKAIAKAMGKEFLRISVGGLDEIEDIKGSQRSVIGAMPGIIIRNLRNASTSDPVVYIEDIDSFGEESGSLLSSAFLEAIDPRLNSKFLDDYLGIPINLNKAFFICGTKSSEEIPEIFSSRFETIELPGYIENEKIMIAKKFIIPELRERHGLLKKDVKFTTSGLRSIIRNYTLEAGLQSMKKRLGIICRHIAREKACKVRKSWIINEKVGENILGTRLYTPETPMSKPEIGVATGLAWTGLGGDLMMIEGLKMKGSGDVITTGSLGEVMKESITAAHSYIRSKADVLGIDHSDFDNFDIHIHFPSGAIPKDGPSAGVAVALVIASVMSERPIPNNIAMTGEITLRGKILQVGGLIEKISAAYRVNIPKIYIPKSNRKDLKDLPADILTKTKIILIETVDEIFAGGLLDFVPSTYTLEKLFAEEIERAKGRKKSRTSTSIAAKEDRKKKRSKR